MQSQESSPPDVHVRQTNIDQADTGMQLSERSGLTAKSPQYESYPEVHFVEMSQQSQLPQAVWDRDSFPQVVPGDQPEAVIADGTTPVVVKDKGKQTILGLRKKIFWATVAAVLLSALIAAVVGGVVGSQSPKAKQAAFLPTTALAAVDYAESNGVVHRRVYFQTDSNALFQSAWDSNSRTWETSPLNPHKVPEPEVKEGTPLAAYIYDDQAHSTIEFHVFFMDTQNRIWERGSPHAEDMWGSQVSHVMSGNYTSYEHSRIAAYAKTCKDLCSSTSVVVWQDVKGGLSSAGYISDYGWWQFEIAFGANRSFLQGSSLSLSPIWGKEGGQGLALYGNTGNLSKLVFNTSAKWEEGWSYNSSFPGDMPPNAMVASFASGDSSGKNSSDVEILAVEPGVAGSNVSWWKDLGYSAQGLLSSGPVPFFPSVSNMSNIAASANGMVYAVDGNELVEWEWQSSSQTFERIGVVNTTING